ncbi:MAG: PilZ domain-containing protein [Thermodesulfobacteriota bacterium]
MGIERRLFTRHHLNIPGSLFLCRGQGGDRISRPTPCRLRDLSRKGAGLLTHRVIVDNLHLFFAPLESTQIVLYLSLILPDGQEECTVATRPVWFDRRIDDEGQPFAMGIEFFEEMDGKLLERLRRSDR